MIGSPNKWVVRVGVFLLFWLPSVSVLFHGWENPNINRLGAYLWIIGFFYCQVLTLLAFPVATGCTLGSTKQIQLHQILIQGLVIQEAEVGWRAAMLKYWH